MSQKRIVIDGKVYNSVDEMPPDVRQNYEEAMRGFKEFNAENIRGVVTDIQNILRIKTRMARRIFLMGIKRSTSLGKQKSLWTGAHTTA